MLGYKLISLGFTPISSNEYIHNNNHRPYRVKLYPNNRLDFYVMYVHKDGTVTWELIGNSIDTIRHYLEGDGYTTTHTF